MANESAKLQALAQASQTLGNKQARVALGMSDQEYFKNLEQGAIHTSAEQIGANEARGLNLSKNTPTGVSANSATATQMQLEASNIHAQVAQEQYRDVIGGKGEKSFSALTTASTKMQTANTIGSAEGFLDIDAKSAGKGMEHLSSMAKMAVVTPHESIDKTASNTHQSFEATTKSLSMAQSSQQAKESTQYLSSFQEQQARGAYTSSGTLTSSALENVQARGMNEGARLAGEINNYKENFQKAMHSTIASSEFAKNRGLTEQDIGMIQEGSSYSEAQFQNFSPQTREAIISAGEKFYEQQGNKLKGTRSHYARDGALITPANPQDRQKAIEAGLGVMRQELQESGILQDSKDFMYKSATTSIEGMYHGDAFGVSAGEGGSVGSLQSGISYTHNESRNYSYGVNASGGSFGAKLASNAGMGMDTYADIVSKGSFALSTLSSAMAFAPGGGVARGMSNLGLISAESSYVTGISRATQGAMKTEQGVMRADSGVLANQNQFRSLMQESQGIAPEARQQIQSQISGAQKSFNATTKARDIERIIQSAKGESGRGGMWKGQGIGGGLGLRGIED